MLECMTRVARMFLDVDFLAGVGAGGFAIASLFIVELQTLADPSVSGGAAVIAFGRWLAKFRRTPAEPDA